MPNPATYRQVTYRLLPRKQSAWRWLERVLEEQRQLYNAALQEREDCWRKEGKSLSWRDQFKSLTRCRHEIPGMDDIPVAIQRGTLKRLDDAIQGFFRGLENGSGAGFPRFRGRRRWNSISIVSGIRIRGNAIHVPRYGPMTVRRHGGNPYPDGVPKSATLKREGGKWYAVVAVAIPAPVHEDNGHAIGIDMNAGQIATSDGAVIAAPDTGRLKARVKRYQKQLARQRRGSRRRERTRARLAKTKRRIATVRHNWHHRTSCKLANAAGTIVIEDLETSRMTRSAKGNGYEARAERERQGRDEPGDPRHRLGGPAPDARVQGVQGDRSRSPLHQPDLCSVRARRRPIAQDTGPVSLRGLRPRRSRRPECSGEHPGLGDWGFCAGEAAGVPGL